jgi:ATP-binding cassette subfamily B protein
MRFYDPTEGSITINDIDLKNYTLESIHSKFSLVPQEPYLFADTILANIKYGKPEVSDKEVIELCQLIGADKFIKILPKGYETILEENGKSLSAGQRQMITIARTMIQNPSFLILDEATSRLDAYSESLVQHAQKKLFEGRTTLVIAHRLSTIKDVNRILVIEKGKIIENGSHEELIVAKGKYFELYNAYYAHQGLTSDEDLLDIAIEEEKPSIPIIKHHSEKRQMPH